AHRRQRRLDAGGGPRGTARAGSCGGRSRVRRAALRGARGPRCAAPRPRHPPRGRRIGAPRRGSAAGGPRGGGRRAGDEGAAARRGAALPGAGRADRASRGGLLGAREQRGAQRGPRPRRRPARAAARLRPGHGDAAHRGPRGPAPARARRDAAGGPTGPRPRAAGAPQRRGRAHRALGGAAHRLRRSPVTPARRGGRGAHYAGGVHERTVPSAAPSRIAAPRPTGSGAVDQSVALWSALAALGLREAVLAPGSRSAPLVYGLAAEEVGARIRAHVRIDERAAAFTALGLSRHDPSRPAAVVTTSGTATAHLQAAVMEAHHSRIPLLVLTADRPAELREVGANQTTRQAGLFGSLVRFAVDLPAPTA